jgi:hypothetical protein
LASISKNTRGEKKPGNTTKPMQKKETASAWGVQRNESGQTAYVNLQQVSRAYGEIQKSLNQARVADVETADRRKGRWTRTVHCLQQVLTEKRRPALVGKYQERTDSSFHWLIPGGSSHLVILELTSLAKYNKTISPPCSLLLESVSFRRVPLQDLDETLKPSMRICNR